MQLANYSILKNKIMKTLISKTMHNSHTFKIVETFPAGYVVWNIGRNNFKFDSYIPLAKPVITEYDFQRCVDPDTLKAIKVADEETALKILNIANYQEIDKNHFEELKRELNKYI